MTTETKSIELNSETAQRIVGSKILIEAPGAYHVQVQNVHHYQGDDRDVHIVSLKAMTGYHQQKAQEFAELGMFQEACNQGLSSSQRPQDYIPSKGEIVKVNVDENSVSAATYGVRGIPTLLLFKNGELVSMVERHHIEGTPAQVIAQHLISVFQEHCN